MFLSFVLSAALAVASPASSAGGAVPLTTPSTDSTSALLLTPQFRRYGEPDGIPSGAVYAVVQDHNGVMWFATACGLVRYDGINFQVFRHSDDDPQSLPAEQTYTLYVDRDNRIWAGDVNTGLIVYDPSNQRFRQWSHDDKNPASLANDEVWSIAQMPDGNMWVATEAGLDRMRPDRSGFDHIPLDVDGTHAASFGSTRALLAETDGRLWIGAASGLYLRQPDGTIHRVPVSPDFHGSLDKIWHIEGGNGEVRVATRGGLLIIGKDGVARPFANAQLSTLNISITSSAYDAQGRLWLASAKGVLLDTGNGHLEQITSQPLLPSGLPDDQAWQVMRDREGGLWFVFDQFGMAYLPPNWNGFTRFTHIPDDPSSLFNTGVLTVFASRDGQLLVGGFNGWIDKLNVATGAVQHISQALSGEINSIAEDAKGRIWAVEGGAVYRLDHGKATLIDTAKAHLTRPVWLVEGPSGHIYVVTWGEGMFVIDPDSLVITPVPIDGQTNEMLFPDQLSMHEGTLWYASSGGLLRLDGQSGKLALVPGVPKHEITALAFDAKGFWVTSDNALEHYHYAGNDAVRDQGIDISHEVFTADLKEILVDRLGNVWVFSDAGLWRFDEHARRFENFGAAQGLSSPHFTNRSVEMFPNGTIFAANTGGVIAFQPGQLLKPKAVPQEPSVTLGKISVRRNGQMRTILYSGDEPLRLGWRDRDLRVEARIASYVDPASNDFRFRLTGFDTDWVDASHRGEREFAGLGSGDYTLDVRAKGGNGQWGHLVTPLRIYVEAPPWMRWWAWLMYAGLAMLLAWLLLLSWRRRLAHRHQIQLAEQRRSLAEQASAAKSHFLATLSHEIRTPMTGVMGMAELLLSTSQTVRQREYTEAMQRSGGLLLKLVNDALDLARIEAGKLELEHAPFDPRALIEDVVRLERGQAQAKELYIHLEMDDALPAWLVGDAVRIKQVLFNLANNALKFTERGGVTMGAHWLDGGLQLRVSDTGPGIPADSQARLFQRFEQNDSPQRRSGSGLGLAICNELVTLMGGSIVLESQLGQGSTFTVRLPLQPAALPVKTSTAPSIVPTGRTLDVLLVEDDSIVAAVIRGLLEYQGHRVRYANNGLNALAELGQGACDVILLDLDLPGIDGFHVARLIRQHEEPTQHVPIIAITARAGGDEEACSREAGMDGFLRKPLTGAQLTDALAVATGAVVKPLTEPDLA
ncbi:MAG: ATP-binding protein [Rhodanobacter sp.]